MNSPWVYTCSPSWTTLPPPTSLCIPSLWVIPVHQPQASCIMHQTWTGDSFHIWYYTCFNVILPNHPTLALSQSPRLFYTSVSLLLFGIQGYRYLLSKFHIYAFSSVQFSSVAQSCPTLCDPMNHSTPGLPVHHQLPEFTQTANTLFQQHKRRLYIWTSPDGQHRNQVDFILCSQRWRSSIQSTKTRPGADCGSDHELLIAKFRLKLKKVGKTTRPYRYDLNQIPYDYTVEVRNRFKGLDMIDRSAWWTMDESLWCCTGIKTISRKKKCNKAKWMSEEALQITCEKKRSEKQRRKGKI